MADITAVQHAGESAMCNNRKVWMPDHVWYTIARLYPTLLQSAACRWLLPMQDCSSNSLEKLCTMEARIY